eukprot:jgi/Mesen1/3156/ME000184S02219
MMASCIAPVAAIPVVAGAVSSKCSLCSRPSAAVPSFQGLRKVSFSTSQSVARKAPATVVRRSVSPRALDLDSDNVVAIGTAVAGILFGIGIPVFYETQVKGAESRENDQPCFPCKGSGAQSCRFCGGTGSITIELGGGEKEVSKCVNCEGAGSTTCTTCQGSGIQPRYLDRREFKDDD